MTRRFPAGTVYKGQKLGGRFASTRQIRDQARREERNAKRRYERARKRGGGRDVAPPGPVVREWEIGIDYQPPARGRGWPVDINIRLRRVDGRSMGRAEALVAASYFMQRGASGAEYEAVGIDWLNPRKASPSWFGLQSTDGNKGRAALESLQGPILAATEWRLGAVEEDDSVPGEGENDSE